MEKQSEQTRQVGNESVQYIDLGLTSGTLWADRNVGAESVYRRGGLYTKTSAPGNLPTYAQCAELINECDFSSCLVPDEDNIMKNFIRVEGPNKNSIFFPCIRPNVDSDEIGSYCWCEDSKDKDFSFFMLFQERLLGVLDIAELTNVTIGMILSDTILMVRNVK